MNYIATPITDKIVIVYCAAMIFIPDSRRVSICIVEIPQSTAVTDRFILQAVADIVILVLQIYIGNSFRRSQTVVDRIFPPLSAYLYPHHRKRSTVSLRLGHATALTVHRTVIHYRVDTALPLNHSRGGLVDFFLAALLGRWLRRFAPKSEGFKLFQQNLYKTPQSRTSRDSSPEGAPMVGVPCTVAGYVWKGVVISATVHGFMKMYSTLIKSINII